MKSMAPGGQGTEMLSPGHFPGSAVPGSAFSTESAGSSWQRDDTPKEMRSVERPARAPANVGLALITTRGLRTVAFMTSSDLRAGLLQQMGRAVLDCDGKLDARKITDDLISADMSAGFLSEDEARRSRTAEQYQSGVMRAFAALATLGTVEDLGDYPPYCAVKAGELLGSSANAASGRNASPDGHKFSRPDLDATEDAIVAAVLALPVRDELPRSLRRSNLDVTRLDAHLARSVSGYRELADDAPGTWQLLADLHDRGLLDVSAAASRYLVTGVRVIDPLLPSAFAIAVSGKAARAAAEIGLLRDFFDDANTCANRKLADYFGADLPDGCCSYEENRCSACWNSGAWPLGESKPKVAVALETPRPRPAGQRVDAAYRQRRLDEQVSRLVWEVFSGVYVGDLYRALRGQDSYFQPKRRRRVRLRSGLVTSRFFGANPSVQLADIEDSLARLQDDRKVVATGLRWRDAEHVRREQARAARAAAAQSGAADVGAAPRGAT